MVKSYRCFGGSQCLHLHGQAFVFDCFTMKMEVLKSFQKSVTVYQSTRRDIPEDFSLDGFSLLTTALFGDLVLQ